jgi:adenosylmethionine-8-amino-7-oxononanoate aminotransferase
MKDYESSPPILIERAKGLKLFDKDGKFYYDTISSWWCNLHGHGHPAIKKAIKAQLDSLEHVLFAGFTHKGAITLAERLLSIAPRNLSRVFFSDDGSTAVETALKMSFQYWRNTGRNRKTVFISLDRGYHGDTIGAMSVSGVSRFNEIFSPLLFKALKIPAPYCYRCPKGLTREHCGVDCIKPLEDILKKRSSEVAALILEPLILAAGGMIVYPVEYLKKAAGLAGRYGIHLIADEVAAGFGRTGRMFACEHAGVEPDFMCLSKGLTAGYLPLGATLTSEKIYQQFYDSPGGKKTFYHGHTYTANPVSCASAVASLGIFRKERTLSRMNDLIPDFHAALERFKELPIVGDVRRIGFIGAFELVKNKRTKEPFGVSERMGSKIYREGLRRNLILRPLGNVTYLFLPLSTTQTELSYIVENTYSAIRSAALQ